MGFWDRVKDRVVGDDTARQQPRQPSPQTPPGPESDTTPEVAPAPATAEVPESPAPPEASADAEPEQPTREPTSPPAGTPAPASSRRSHTVELGETLEQIAARHDTTVEAVAQHNALQHPDRIYPGQVLQIP